MLLTIALLILST